MLSLSTSLRFLIVMLAILAYGTTMSRRHFAYMERTGFTCQFPLLYIAARPMRPCAHAEYPGMDLAEWIALQKVEVARCRAWAGPAPIPYCYYILKRE